MVAWGAKSFWQTPREAAEVPVEAASDVKAISSGMYGHLALRVDGAVIQWTPDFGPATVHAGLSNFTAISASEHNNHMMALLGDGSLEVWGDDFYGQVSGKPAGLVGVSAIAAGSMHCLALLKNGTVVMWGGNRDVGQVPLVAQSDVTAIAASAAWSMALLRNGSVVAWHRQVMLAPPLNQQLG